MCSLLEQTRILITLDRKLLSTGIALISYIKVSSTLMQIPTLFSKDLCTLMRPRTSHEVQRTRFLNSSLSYFTLLLRPYSFKTMLSSITTSWFSTTDLRLGLSTFQVVLSFYCTGMVLLMTNLECQSQCMIRLQTVLGPTSLQSFGQLMLSIER